VPIGTKLYRNGVYYVLSLVLVTPQILLLEGSGNAESMFLMVASMNDKKLHIGKGTDA
jgi:hypothetical protein